VNGGRDQGRAAVEISAAARAAWAARFPQHCRQCEGWGWVNVVVGDEECAELEGDLCPGCLYRHHCPRCAAAFDTFDQGRCAVCGWAWEEDGRGMPPEVLEDSASDINDPDFTDPFAEVGP
jgi:hypothetical protein